MPRRGGRINSLYFFNNVCRLGDGKEFLFQAKDEVSHRTTLWKQYLREAGIQQSSSHSLGWNELLDSFHPGLRSIRTRRLPRRSPGTQPRHDHASHLAQLCRGRRCDHAQQRRERQGSGEEVQLLWQKEIEQTTARSYVCQNFNQVKQAGRKVQPGHTNIRQAPRNSSTARLWLTENFFFSPVLNVISFFIHPIPTSSLEAPAAENPHPFK